MASGTSVPEQIAGPIAPRLGTLLDWLAHHDRQVLAIGVVAQVVLLLAMLVQPLTTLATGDTVLLRVAPIDPRDLFRGDYVILRYDINRLDSGSRGWSGTNWERMRNMEGKQVFVLLEPEPDGKHWRFSSHSFEPPTAGKFIRGTIAAYGRAEFGIEKFFVQQGQGRVYEKAVRERKLAAEVVIGQNGSAQLKRLIIE